jgi:uncharacterized OB-fold protein
MTQLPLADGLFTWPSDNPSLIGGRGPDGKVVFPYRSHRIIDGVRQELEQVELPRQGTLWTFTTQNFRPTSPPYAGNDDAATFQPFALGYIELPGALKIESRLTVADPDRLHIGQPMQLVIEPFGVDEHGNETVMFAFAPIAEEVAE